jgi:hypothetical protein
MRWNDAIVISGQIADQYKMADSTTTAAIVPKAVACRAIVDSLSYDHSHP